MFKKIFSLILLSGMIFAFPGLLHAQSVPAACSGVTFVRRLELNSVGNDVKCLQVLLNQDVSTRIANSGAGSSGSETTRFGLLTRAAVIRFQEKYKAEVLTPAGLARGTGTVGAFTNAKLNMMLSSLMIPILAPSPVASPTPIVSPVAQLSQAEMITTAIGKVNPAVVSINITKQVPEYEITYQYNGYNQVAIFQPTGRTTTQRVGAGTGFVISADGYIVTNKHVASNFQYTYTAVFNDGTSQQAQLIAQDPNNDIAILKMDGNSYPYVHLGDSDTLNLGQSIVVIGNALGQFSNTVTVGIVSGLHRNIQADSIILKDVIQMDAAINPGNSGGPVIDLNGNVVGVTVAMATGSNNISFALTVNPVKAFINTTLGR